MNKQLEVRHNTGAHRFEAVVNGQLCRADYAMRGDVMAMHHTEVPSALQGRGIAAQLVAAAVDYARANGLRIAAYCRYVQGYVRRHPEVSDIVAE